MGNCQGRFLVLVDDQEGPGGGDEEEEIDKKLNHELNTLRDPSGLSPKKEDGSLEPGGMYAPADPVAAEPAAPSAKAPAAEPSPEGKIKFNQTKQTSGEPVAVAYR